MHCGPILFDFKGVDGDKLDSTLFTFSDPNDVDEEVLEFTVMEQNEQSSRGEYLIRYKAYLRDYPAVSLKLDEPFVVVIENPPTPEKISSAFEAQEP